MKCLDILILDDDRRIGQLLADAVSADGHHGTISGSISDLREKIKRHQYDVFLIDMNLPDGSGLDVAQSLRATTDAGIIIVSGRNDAIDKVLALELGADDYITKPFHIREVRARIKSVARRLMQRDMHTETVAGLPPTDVYQVDEFQINLRARSVVDRRAQVIDLTTLEFDLLVALTSPPNVVLTRERIMEALRGPDWVAYDRTVDGLVSRLRAKLFPDGSGSSYVKTVRGVGYMYSSTS